MFRVFGFRVLGCRLCRVCGVILKLEGGVGDRIPGSLWYIVCLYKPL